MPVPLLLTFVSTVAFAIQLLIFAYLYSSHRVRFFQYLLLAWGAYTLSKGLKLVDMVVFDLEQPGVVTGVATVAAVGFMLAAAFAYRWDYRLRARDLLIGGAVALLLSLANDVGGADEGLRLVGVGLGALQMVAGASGCWPVCSRCGASIASRRSSWPRPRGRRPTWRCTRYSSRSISCRRSRSSSWCSSARAAKASGSTRA